MRLYIGLVHYPVYNKNFERIASAITTIDLHDIARLARTYEVRRFFVITPLDDQKLLAEQIRRHWTEGYGARYNADRKEAFGLLRVVSTIEQATSDVAEIEEETPLLIATDASKQETGAVSYEMARNIIFGGRPVILIFGTAWGLDKAVITSADHVLEPISGRTSYNHLSVRSAVAIILDRLVGR